MHHKTPQAVASEGSLSPMKSVERRFLAQQADASVSEVLQGDNDHRRTIFDYVKKESRPFANIEPCSLSTENFAMHFKGRFMDKGKHRN
jgi:hypothetical protein